MHLSRLYSTYIACSVSIISLFSLCFFAYHHENQSLWDSMLMCCNSHSWEQVLKLLFILLLVACILFVVYFVDVIQKTKRFLSTLIPYKRGHLPQEIENFQQKYSIRIHVIDDKRPIAFTYGFIYPQIVISTGIVQILDSDEVKAVLEHEYCHYKDKDPFKLSLYKCLTRLFFFLPVSQKILQRYVTQKELAADSFAIEQVGLKPIASALYKLMSYSSSMPFSTVHFQNGELQDVRIEFLLTGTFSMPSLTKKEWMVSVLHFIFITLITGCVSFLWHTISFMPL